MKIEQIKKVMLGHSNCNVSLVIITPLKSTFYRLKEKLNVEKEYNSAFYENFVFKINKKDLKGLIILSPQGIASQDVVELFCNTNILFFGLAGSLNTKYEIGSFVEVKNAVIEEKDDITLVTTGKYKMVKCGYSPCLIGALAKKYCNFAKFTNCDVVDMETAYCAKTAIKKNNKFTALLLVSDIPDVINFWEISDKMQNKLKECRLAAIDEILNYIDILAERK